MEKELVRVRSVRDIVISAAMVAAGIALVLMPSIPVNILGCCMAIPGVLMLLFLKTDYKDAETGQHFRRIIKYYPASMKAEIMSALKGDPSKSDWKPVPSANDGLMLDIYVSRSGDKVYVRMSEFVPYNYVPCSDWLTYTAEQAGRLIGK